MATAYFEGDTEEADALVTYLYDNREQEVVRKLKSVSPFSFADCR